MILCIMLEYYINIEQKKILISLNNDLYEINARNIFLKEHTEELIKITNTCLTSKQSSTQ